MCARVFSHIQIFRHLNASTEKNVKNAVLLLFLEHLEHTYIFTRIDLSHTFIPPFSVLRCLVSIPSFSNTERNFRNAVPLLGLEFWLE